MHTSTLLLTAVLIKPVAPLLAPLTKVGTESEVAWFKFNLVYVWTSNNERFHSFKDALLASYDPDSNL